MDIQISAYKLLSEKVTYSKFRYSKFKQFVSWSVFEELQLTQISLNFQTSCWNLKINGLGAKLCVTFLLLLFRKELRRFKLKQPMLFVEQKFKL